MKKPGRNDLCPCGSGKKFKKCCLPANVLSESRVPPLPASVMIKLKERLQAEQERKTKYGEVRPVIHADFNGYKFVAVGSKLYYSKDWKTFPDFLLEFIKLILGKDWGKDELSKPLESRHAIMKWDDAMCRFQKKQVKGTNGLFGAAPNGPMLSYLLLLYDLYTLCHHDALQDSLLRKLRNPDQLQGARHELFAAATCIRAGFKLEYENEADRTKKHAEFIAIHEITGQKVSVEAKSRHRMGVLGYPGTRDLDDRIRLRIGRLINTALLKASSDPLVVFLDLNIPPLSVRLFEKPWIDEINKTFDRVEQKSGGNNRYNLVVLSNMPFYYDESDNPSPKGDILSIVAKNPLIPIPHPEALRAIHIAANKFGNIPNKFEE